VKKYLLIFLSIIVLASCSEARLSQNELAEEVKRSMRTNPQFVQNDIDITSFLLTRNAPDSNIYTGILETSEPAGEFAYKVTVTYDGTNFTWEIEQ
jgi:PBP1b-binding outer membrane lipoprotein LpoB